jgi:hypothetical protein
MSGPLTVMAWASLGLLYVVFYFGVRHKEVRAAWISRGEGNGWNGRLLIPRSERPWMAWATFVVYGLSALIWFSQGTLWLAIPSTALCLIGLVQGIWGQAQEDA